MAAGATVWHKCAVCLEGVQYGAMGLLRNSAHDQRASVI